MDEAFEAQSKAAVARHRGDAARCPGCGEALRYAERLGQVWRLSAGRDAAAGG